MRVLIVQTGENYGVKDSETGLYLLGMVGCDETASFDTYEDAKKSCEYHGYKINE